jgi:two-component system, OmpR family, sensor histidine kinase KdpD
MATGRREEGGRSLAEDLLCIACHDEKKAHEGKLTVYLDYSACVWKPYSMLQDSLQRLQEGKDATVGYIEIHDRPEINALVSNLEVIPTVSIEHHGLEIDPNAIDSILK